VDACFLDLMRLWASRKEQALLSGCLLGGALLSPGNRRVGAGGGGVVEALDRVSNPCSDEGTSTYEEHKAGGL